MALSRPSSQMTRYTMVSPPPFSRPSSVMSRISRPASVKLAKAEPYKCNVCSNKIDYQWILPGVHNFCKSCLENYIIGHSRGKHCHCPICRAGIRLPKGQKLTRKLTRYPHGNDVILCDICEDAPALYKCSECNEFFCERCNKLHLRMKVGSNHHVSFMSSIRSVNEKLKVKVYCDIHEHEELKFYCKKCEMSICRDCKVVAHEGHLTTAIGEVVNERKDRIANSITTAKSHMARLKAESVEIKSKKASLEEETHQIETEIRQHCNRIKDVIDEQGERLIATVRNHNEEIKAKLDSSLEAINQRLETIRGLIDQSSIQMDMSTDVAFVNASHDLDNSLRATDTPSFIDKLWRRRYTFAKGGIDEMALQVSVGELKQMAEGMFVPTPTIELQLHTTFNCDQNFPSTSSITPLPDGSAWVCNGFKNKVQRFDNTGRVLQKDTVDFDIDDMTTLLDGTVLLTEYNGKAIRRLGAIHRDTYFVKSDMVLRGIALSRDGMHIIVLGNDMPVTKMKQTRVSKILFYSILGQKEKEIRITKGLNLFRVCQTVNKDLIVSTGVSGKFLVIGSDGLTKFSYTASGSADGVACDAQGLVVMTDLKDDTLHLLDSKGNPLPYTYSMNKPNAVSVDNRGYIWIGDMHRIKLMKYV